ncbi:AAA family ATPase [Galactobacillus timonensis]|uniref:AAA family ATPase n=1 Tax=Galactobacillus timonensis TaxID=2041840 RepID=UPI000C8553FA|nr:ATP-binding protein [Galactobacillus timonensis]
MENAESNPSFDDKIMKAFKPVWGFSDLKKRLMTIAKILKDPPNVDESGDHEPSGLLLYGYDAMGKTLLAKCLIQASGRKAYRICIDRPDRNWDTIIHSVFEEALAHAPSIVYLADLETYVFQDESTAEKIKKELMNCIDSVHGKHVFVLVACNPTYAYDPKLVSRERIDLQIYIDCLEMDQKCTVDFLRSSLKELNISSDLAPEEILKLFGWPLALEPARLRNFVQEAADEAVQSGYSSIHVSNYYHALLSADEEAPVYAFHQEQRDINRTCMQKKAYEIAAKTALWELYFPGSTHIAGVFWFHGARGIRWGSVPDQCKKSFLEQRIEEDRKFSIIDASPRMISLMKFGRSEPAPFSENESVNSVLEDMDQEGFFDHAERFFPVENANERLKNYWYWLLIKEAERTSLSLLKKNESFVDLLAEELLQNEFLLEEQIQECRQKRAQSEQTVFHKRISI